MLTRRAFLAAAGAAAAALPFAAHAAVEPGAAVKKIPGTGVALPVIGMGSWITFDVGADADARARRTAVLKEFFARGGGMIDSSPMYGTSETVLGHCLQALGRPRGLFAATKVWTPGKDHGVRQMAESERLWGVRPFDLLQVHNLLGWEGHLETLMDWKAQGRVRHIGVTTSHGRRHDELATIMTSQPIDFVQLTYNIEDREAEQRLLPLAAEKGIAVIANRPFQRGALIDRLQGRPLPPWAEEMQARSWPQFLLKFVVTHPAVTCAIPATSRVDHMRENMAAAWGPMPSGKIRDRMAAYVEAL
ncbi:MAG: aldo/keto reductase [Rhodospirillales bacterium]